MPWYSIIIGAAIVLLFIFSVVSFVKALIQFVQRKKHKNDPKDPESDIDGTSDNLNKEV